MEKAMKQEDLQRITCLMREMTGIDPQTFNGTITLHFRNGIVNQCKTESIAAIKKIRC